MKYCLLQGHNIIVKEEEGWKPFCPYTGNYDENDNSLHELGNYNMTEVSSEKAENYVKAAKIAKAAHKGQKDKGEGGRENMHDRELAMHVFWTGNARSHRFFKDCRTGVALPGLREETRQRISETQLKKRSLPADIQK